MISAKQRRILAFEHTNYSGLICDGAIRSGKTAIIMWSFVAWAMRNFNRQQFGIGGHTVDSATQNIIKPFISMAAAKERYKLEWKPSKKILEVRQGSRVNWFEVCGGKDESSFMLIQGRTWAGMFLDEVVLMPESFVNQARARCSVDGARYWFSCNPGPPEHWFKKEWIDKRDKKNILYLHFALTDNPAHSQETITAYMRDYTGVFYDRYILGRWVVADGLVYQNFSKDGHVLDEEPETDGEYFVSCDFGIQNATVFLLWRKEAAQERWVCLDEYYYSGRETTKQKTTSELVDGLAAMLGERRPKQVIVDPSAASLIVELRKRGYHVRNAVNDVVPGIADVSTLLQNKGLAFTSRCKNTIKEFGLYAWDKRAADRGEDAPIKQNDHAMDAVRYFVKTMGLVKKIGKPKYIPLYKR